MQDVSPELDGGRYAVKREEGDVFVVEADIFKEGHDKLAARVVYRAPDETAWQSAPMAFADNDRWRGEFPLERIGRYAYSIEAWPDLYRSWAADTEKKVTAGQDVASDLLEGARLLRRAAERAPRREAERLRGLATEVEGVDDPTDAVAVALAAETIKLAAAYPDPALTTRYDRDLEVIVDRIRARYAAWYEIFPRSQGTDPTRSATFREAEARIPAIAAMGFDVLYMTPIHPIGHTNRKGPNNSLVAGPNDPGSPYAIGSEAGGHTAIAPELGTLEDFDHFQQVARRHGMELALDFAIQASPDHPWVKEHPEWFYRRADGTIKFAENPPKKYEDIYPLNFHCEDWPGLWSALKDVVTFWCARGVRIFRVDNPHTKPLDFWIWLIREVQREYPDAIFLSEAFTRPKVMKTLAKAGFTQSYTYFTWRNEKAEIEEYLTELTSPPVSEYMRGNLFVNTPDILPEVLQKGGRPAFIMRLVLAATTSSVYGVYNGFELLENTPRAEGSEYYLDSEMYQHKVWDWDRPGNIVDIVARVNRARRENPALQLYENLRFYGSEDPNILFYGKATPDRSNIILVALNLDPFATHWGGVYLPPGELGIRDDEQYDVVDLLSGERWTWFGRHNWVRLDPHSWPAHILRVDRRV
ncbi:MAG: alpha-1,4-glucan--maltose-1-phosphate maltosyltransferase [Chloroflexota bacterium]|nr:alpha-1,4-glucan--maltose-1-phosphate maltosyltransferase [Chloroflexota bacterium]